LIDAMLLLTISAIHSSLMAVPQRIHPLRERVN
jgi:hypothetical protein